MRLSLDRTGLVEPFRVLTVTLLSLLVPLSFLLLSRLSCAHYSPYPAPTNNLLLSLRTLLHALVSPICVATLVHALTGRSAAAGSAVNRIGPLRLLGAWIYLCLLQVCVGLGIEGSLMAGIDGVDAARGATLLSRVVFFVGMHEATSYWAGEAVGPVVDDTVFGEGRPTGWAQRACVAAGCGALWWWRLREEVGAMVLVAEARIELGSGVGVADFVGWWLYYLTVTIGMVKVVKTVMWVGMVLLCRRVRVRGNGNSNNRDRGNSNSSSSTVITEEQLQPCDWEDKV